MTIRRTQSKSKSILADSSSLYNFLEEIYLDCYQNALENMRIEYDANFPETYPFSINVDELLNKKFWEYYQSPEPSET